MGLFFSLRAAFENKFIASMPKQRIKNFHSNVRKIRNAQGDKVYVIYRVESDASVVLK